MRGFMTSFFMAAILSSPGAHAAAWSPPTDAELKMLPAFCADKLRAGDPRASRKKWLSIIGSQYDNVHHYCYGLNFLNRYYSAPYSAGAKSNLAMAKAEIGGVVQKLAPGSTLAGEILLHRGIVNSLMKKDAEALQDFLEAVSLNPRLAKIHLTLADYYHDRKQQVKALEALSEGLRYVPDSEALKRRYKEFGGKLPYPEPIVAIPEPEARTEESAKNDNPNTSSQPVVEQTNEGDPPVEKPMVNQDSVIGTPKNPWCRFCPPEEK